MKGCNGMEQSERLRGYIAMWKVKGAAKLVVMVEVEMRRMSRNGTRWCDTVHDPLVRSLMPLTVIGPP